MGVLFLESQGGGETDGWLILASPPKHEQPASFAGPIWLRSPYGGWSKG